MSEIPPSIDLVITMLSGVGADSHVQVTRALAGIVKLHQQQIAALMGNQPPPAGSPDANGDLTEAELKCVLARACCAKGPCPNCSCRAGREIQRHRTAQAASKERVMEVVLEAMKYPGCVYPPPYIANAIASRVADQLATPAVLSAEERETAKTLRQTVAEFVFLPEVPRVIALLDRLLGVKP